MNNKPIQLSISEIKAEIASIINQNDLPMCVITPIIKEIYEQCQSVERQQYEMAKQQYENMLAEENKEASNEESETK